LKQACLAMITKLRLDDGILNADKTAPATYLSNMTVDTSNVISGDADPDEKDLD